MTKSAKSAGGQETAGREPGIEETFELPLNEREQAAFRASCEHIRGNIAQLGEWWNTESRVK